MATKKGIKRNSVLGRGLEALLQESSALSGSTPVVGMQAIAIDHIEANPHQPRRDFNEKSLQDLRDSIQVHGIIQPITLRKLAHKRYQLIAGERRWQAAKLAGKRKIPAYVREVNNQQMLEMALVENIQREDLNPIEVALSYQRLMSDCNIKQEVLAARVGKDRTTISNYLRLLKLPPAIQIALRDRKIDMGHARALINAGNTSTQLELLQQIIAQSLSVREVEALVKRTTQLQQTSRGQQPGHTPLTQRVQSIRNSLAKKLDTQVSIHVGAQKKGNIKITFSNAQDLDRILTSLSVIS